METYNTKIILRKDTEWALVQDELCLVTDFNPLMGSMVKDEMVTSPVTSEPYASINIKCIKVPTEKNVTGFITHKLDFKNLWSAFKTRGIRENEEVLIYWSTKHYRYKIFRILSAILLKVIGGSNLPKVVVMICPKGTYGSLTEGFSWQRTDEALVMIYGLMSISWWMPDAINQNKYLSNSVRNS